MDLTINKDGIFYKVDAINKKGNDILECFIEDLIDVNELFETIHSKHLKIVILAVEVWWNQLKLN